MSQAQRPGRLALGLSLLAFWAGWAYIAYAYVEANGPVDRIVHAGGASLALAVAWVVVSVALLFLGIFHSITGLRARSGNAGV